MNWVVEKEWVKGKTKGEAAVVVEEEEDKRKSKKKVKKTEEEEEEAIFGKTECYF